MKNNLGFNTHMQVKATILILYDAVVKQSVHSDNTGRQIIKKSILSSRKNMCVSLYCIV